MYITTKDALESFLSTATTEGLLAIDTEFHSEKTYYPKLCLIQLGVEHDQAIVDPLMLHDLSPLAAIFQDTSVVKVFHAGSQDIGILLRACGAVPDPVFDTQVAAGLLGQSQQLGYGALVKAFCNVTLPKADSYTDWTRRPLSRAQLEYARDDVTYLPPIYHMMVSQLSDQNRMEWLSDEFASLANPATYELEPDQAWRKLRRISSFTRRQLAALQGGAAWRETNARKRNIPRKWVLPDEVLIEAARRVPQDMDSLVEVRGLREQLGERDIRSLLDSIQGSLARDPEDWPNVSRHHHPQRESEGVVDLMQALLHLRASEKGIAPQILATREDLSRIARGEGDDVDLMNGWRKRIVGNEIISLLEGEISLSVADGTLKVTERSQKSPDEEMQG